MLSNMSGTNSEAVNCPRLTGTGLCTRTVHAGPRFGIQREEFCIEIGKWCFFVFLCEGDQVTVEYAEVLLCKFDALGYSHSSFFQLLHGSKIGQQAAAVGDLD